MSERVCAYKCVYDSVCAYVRVNVCYGRRVNK